MSSKRCHRLVILVILVVFLFLRNIPITFHSIVVPVSLVRTSA